MIHTRISCDPAAIARVAYETDNSAVISLIDPNSDCSVQITLTSQQWSDLLAGKCFIEDL